MMLWLPVSLLVVLVNGGGGVTKSPGLTQFWTDDYNVFEQVYGKTSDKDLYGAELARAAKSQERKLKTGLPYGTKIEETNENDEPAVSGTQVDPYGLTDSYSNLLTKQMIEDAEKLLKPTKPSFKFIGYNEFKPISQTTDPETYNYYKHLELLSKTQNLGFPLQQVSGFKPYAVNYGATNPENTDAYKSIQDILDAHEANKGAEKQQKFSDVKYADVKYSGGNRGKKPAKSRYIQHNDLKHPRCSNGRCRKRATSPVRVRSRPIVTRIKHRVVSDD